MPVPPTSIADSRGETLVFRDKSTLTITPEDRRRDNRGYREACHDAVRRTFDPRPDPPAFQFDPAPPAPAVVTFESIDEEDHGTDFFDLD